MSNLYQDWKRGPSKTPSAHEQYIWGAWRALGTVYQYDAAEDGPECEVITRILARHPIYVSGAEKQRIEKSIMLDTVSRLVYWAPFDSITPIQQRMIRDMVATRLAGMQALGLL